MYEATLEGGESVSAHSVVVAPGLRHFAHIPIELVAELPLDRYSHACDINSFDALKGKRCLIVGGRQSAFEWAALMVEAGAAEVHISYRHDTPRFAPSDWSWVDAIVDHIGRSPGWSRPPVPR